MKAHLLWSGGQKHIKKTNKKHPKVVLQKTHNAGAKIKGLRSNKFIKADSQKQTEREMAFQRRSEQLRGYQDKTK